MSASPQAAIGRGERREGVRGLEAGVAGGGCYFRFVAAPGQLPDSSDAVVAGALEARGPTALGKGFSRGCTVGSSGVIWKISRKMPGVMRDSGLAITSGLAIEPLMA